MTDKELLIFGAVVTFIAVGGAYIYLRERYEKLSKPVRVREDSEPARRIRSKAA